MSEELKTKQEREKSFYSAIGRSISVWAETEGLLIFIAALLLHTTPQKTGIILYSITNFYSWLSIIDDLFAHERAYSGQKDEWGQIATLLKKLNNTRVRLAHHSARSDDDIPPALRPHRYDIRSKWKDDAPLSGTEIGKFAEDITTAAAKIMTLVTKMIAAQKALQGTHPAPSTDPHKPSGAL